MSEYLGTIEIEKTYFHVIKDKDGFKTCDISNVGVIHESEPYKTLEELYNKILEMTREALKNEQ